MSTFSKFSPAADFAAELSTLDNFDFALTAAFIAVAQTEITNLKQLHRDLLYEVRRQEANRKYNKKGARPSRKRKRTSSLDGFDDDEEEDRVERASKFPSWSEIRDGISDKIFRRKYRMSKEQYKLLCDRILAVVGEEEFRTQNNQGLCGEMRIAIGLRLLCGGSYLDLIGRAYGVDSIQSIYNYFHTLINWIDRTFDFPLVGLLRGLENDDAASIAKLNEISSDFAMDSDGCFVGCIGAMDGLAVRIKCPNASDPGNYFCRKNFYALNAQAICDRQKRILWISPGHLGASHDSTAWQETKLHGLVERLSEKLKDKGFFFVGDSAYPLSVYLQVPYSNARPGSPQDAFNFWLSNSRIQIECTFGELIMRFGLFWRTLRFDENTCVTIINAAAKLHNFLVDCRENTADDTNYFRNMSYANTPSVSIFSIDDDSDETDFNFPLVTDNNQPKPSGRKSKERINQEEEGSALRDELCVSLYESGMGRPPKSNMRYNGLGHVYFAE